MVSSTRCPGTSRPRSVYLIVAEESWLLSDAVEHAPKVKVSLPVPVFQLRFAHGWIMVDAAMDRATAAAAGDTSRFFDDRFSRAVDALRGANLIVVTHEHYDHVGLVGHSGIADELAPKTMLTRAQMKSLLHHPEMTLIPFDSTRAARYIVFDYDRMLPIAPGVVLIKAPGHTPGSQVIYVKLASGREVILSGDVALNHLGIETQRQKPDSTRRHTAERAAIAGELAWLHQASVDTSKPAISRHLKTGHHRRGARDWWTGYRFGVVSTDKVSPWTFVRQLRGPHLRTWA